MTEVDTRLPNPESDAVATMLASDDLYRALAAAPRRLILFYLLAQEQTTVAELADFLYGWGMTTGEQASYDILRTQLYHTHLPRLAASDLVAFDPETGRVERLAFPEAVRKLVRCSILAETHDSSRDC